jgi:hypothetical protein
METYTGHVRALTRCFVDGEPRNTGEVFEVRDHILWSDSPYQAVEVSHVTEDPMHATAATKRVVHAHPIMAPVHPAGLRGHHADATGMRPDA